MIPLAMTEWIPYGVTGGCVVLLVLVAFLFRKLYRFDREVKAKEQSLQRLDAELSFKEQLQDKAFGIIAEVENAHPQLQDLLDFFFRQLKMGYVGIFCPECNGGEGLVLQVPVPAVMPEKFLEWLRHRLSPAFGGTLAPFRIGTGENPEFVNPEGGLPAQPALVFPLLPRGTPTGAMIFCLPAAELDRREKELHRIGKLYEALISYRLLQSEIAFRTEEANVVSLFLTEIATFAAIDNLFDAMYDYFRDTYPQAGVTILLEEDGNLKVRKGALIEEEIVFQLVPKARQELERGRQMLYGADPLGLVKKYQLPYLPHELKAILIVPLVTFHQIFGYIVFESRTPNPFRSGTLSTIIRLAEIGSFVLRKMIFFQEEIGQRTAEIERLQGELAAARRSLEENELVLREVTNYNAIFTLTQGVRMNVTSLKGFLQLGENNFKATSPASYDPVFFRNCYGELEKIEKGAQKLELSRIITDREFAFKTGDVDATEFLTRIFQSVRTKAVLKRIEVDTRFDTRLQRLRIDPEVTAMVLQQFLERLLDFASAGKLQSVGVAKEDRVELLVKFQPGDGSGRAPAAAAGMPDLRRDFHHILASRVIARQGGQMDLEVTAERGFLFRLTFPGTPAE
jgi:hypothetical protein